MKVKGPLALFPLPGGETVVSRQVRLVKQVYPEARFTFVGGFEAEHVFKKLPNGVLAVENELFDDYAIGRSLEIGLRCCVQKRLLLIYGDLVFTDQLIEKLPAKGSHVCLGKATSRDVGVNSGSGKVRFFHYALAPKWLQIALLDGEELISFKKLAPNYRDKMVHELLNKVIRDGGRLNTHHIPGPLWEIDTVEDLDKVLKDLGEIEKKKQKKAKV